MNPTDWINKHYGIEFFSGDFEKLNRYIHTHDYHNLKSKVITIAGTNGKGQTARVLAKMLKDSNVSYILWTSPHMNYVNERFDCSGSFVTDDTLLSIFHELQNEVENLNFSYFEFLYLAFLKLVKKYSPEIIIQEVGLGGRLDATNTLDSDLSAITSISRDHQEILGNSYKSILLEKIAISRNSRPLITCLDLDYLKQLAQNYTQENSIYWRDLIADKVISKKDHFSKRNIELAKALYETILNKKFESKLEFDVESKRGVYKYRTAHYDLFPTHNPDGLRKLVQFLNEEQYNIHDLILFAPSKRSMMDLRIMCKILLSFYPKDKLRLVSFEHYKALEKMDFTALKNEFDLQAINNISKFFQENQSHSNLVIGSNYFLHNFNSSSSC